MNQKESPARQTQGSIEADEPSFPQFTIADLSAVEYGRIRWTFNLKVGPVTVECRVIVGEDGRPKFAAPAQIKDARTQGYRSTVDVDRAFMHKVFHTVVAQIEGAAAPVPAARTRGKAAPTPGQNAWAMDQEARFERAITQMDGAA